MAKPAELAHISSTVRFGNGKYSLTALPFPPATAHERHRANAFNYWEQEVTGKILKGAPIRELMDIIGDHITLEPISARLFAKGVLQEIHKMFFTHDIFLGLFFADDDRKEHLFEEPDIAVRSAGLTYYRLRSTVDH
jgi:hypothetical protein